jgi:hypothetical protein
MPPRHEGWLNVTHRVAFAAIAPSCRTRIESSVASFHFREGEMCGIRQRIGRKSMGDMQHVVMGDG